MNRVVLHLLGSLFLGFALLGVAEMVGRAEAQASSVALHAAPPVAHSTIADSKASMLERCWDLVGVSRSTPAPTSLVVPVRKTEAQATHRTLPFGWSYLPPLSFAS